MAKLDEDDKAEMREGMQATVEIIVEVSEHLAAGELGVRAAKAQAKVARLTYDAMREENFSADEALTLTAAALGARGGQK